MDETWRTVPGYAHLYQVSDLGHVRSIGTARGYRPAPLPRRAVADERGRLFVTLCRNGNYSRRSVHSLVAEAFLGPRPEGMVARHLDGDHTNNTPGNLAWGTQAENMEDMVAHGRSTRKFSADEVRRMREQWERGVSQALIALVNNVSTSTLHGIVHRKTYKDVV